MAGKDAAGADTHSGDRNAGYDPLDECSGWAAEGLGVRIDNDIVKNLEFLRSMRPEEFEKYRGEWLAVVGGGIVAHGKDPRRVHQEGWKAGKGEPFMEYIYAGPEELTFLHVE